MARGRGRGRGGSSKRSSSADDQPPSKLKRQESENSKIRRAIKEASSSSKAEDDGDKNFKIDKFLSYVHFQAEIYEDYTCMLNQTNIGHNNNKFYIIQVAKEKKNFICFTRWGRVGEDGQNNVAISKNADDAIKAFKKKFKDKTKNDWDKRDSFTAHSGKYTMIEIDEDAEDSAESGCDEVDFGNLKRELKPSKTGCKLPYRTQLMVSLIFMEDMFRDQMASMHLDVRKMPLGKLSKTQINKGLEALINVEEAIKSKKPRKLLEDLSSKFYTLVPHDFGRMVPQVLDTMEIVREKKEVMLTLSDIELTQSLQKDKANPDVHPILEKYEMLDCDLELLDQKSNEFKLLQQYVSAEGTNTYGKLLDVWKMDRNGESDRFNKHNNIKNRKLLWHGTNVAVVAAILKAGLRIMPHSGGRVGRGIYFASEYDKSAGYVGYHYGKFEGEEDVGFMFLAEVALGKESTTLEGGDFKVAPKGFDSIVARGTQEPDPKKDQVLKLEGKDVVVPIGKPVEQKQWEKSYFDQSEYLVYKESQAHLRYLLKLSFVHNC